MNNDINTIRKLKNVEGKRLLTKNILEYSKEIISDLQNNPSSLEEILDELEIPEEDFFAYISGDKKGNISFYDQTLYLVKTKTKRM